MTPDEHRRAKELFLRAELLQPAEREQVLAAAAVEDEVLAEVRRLLRLAATTPDGFLAPREPLTRARSIAAGQRLGPYEIVAPLAAGGMGEVWRARDTRLGRDVAIKVLAPELDRDTGRRARFEREARAVAALSHSNILALYDFDHRDGVTYAVTELLEGETLREQLRAGALPVRRAVEVAIQIARALGAAHGKGIVHRDLKPENIFVTPDGQVKLLDFGIAALPDTGPETDGAREADRSVGAGDTLPGTVLGTPGYMAPEQVRGQPADHRSDLFALGCVLYEMLTGRRVFGRATTADSLAAVLAEEPEPIALPDAAWSSLQSITAQCLDKDPGGRFQSARDLAFRLGALLRENQAASGAPSSRPRAGARRILWPALALAAAVAAAIAVSARSSEPEPARAAAPVPAKQARIMIAVLPFESIGGDAEQERFADGMTEEMITVLGRARPERLGVIARTSAMTFKGRRASVTAIGRDLGVDHLVEGSVRRQGDQVRIAAKLIRVADQTQMWSDSFDGSLQDILGLQSDVARRIAAALSVELLPGSRAVRRTPETDPRAYDAYLAGRAAFHRANEQGWRAAIGHYKEAVALDPGFALAHAAIASGYTTWALWGTTPPSDARARAIEAVDRAQELDPDLAEVHSTRALIEMFFEWRWAEAERELARAIALNPSDGEVYHWYAHYLLLVGRPQEALESLSEALRFDPLAPFHRACLGGHFVAMGELDRAEPLLRRVVEQAPDSALAHHYLGWLYERRGHIDDAVAAWQEAARISDIPNLLATVGYGYARAGRLPDAHRIQAELEKRASRGYVAALDRAKIFAGLGHRDAAFALLDRAYAEHDAWLAALKLEPGFDTLRDDPRYADLLRRIGLPP